MLVVVAALVSWSYDIGRRFAGFDRSASETEIGNLHARIAELEGENARLGALAHSGENSVEIERTTREQMLRQIKTLEEDNIRLKENLAVYESLASGGNKRDTVSLSRFSVDPGGQPGHYRYRVLVSRQGAKTEPEFRGELQFRLAVQQPDGKSAMMVLPQEGERNRSAYTVEFRNFRSFEGSFQIDPALHLQRIEARLVQGDQIKATQSLTF